MALSEVHNLGAIISNNGFAVGKMNLEDDDSQDLNNPMVNDLVSKILDDDSIIGESARNNGYDSNTQYRSHLQSYNMEKMESYLDTYPPSADRFGTDYPLSKLEYNGSNNAKLECNYNNLCEELKTLNLNMCPGRTADDTNLYGNGIATYSNAYPPDSQSYALRPNDGNSCMSMPLCNDLLTTTSETNYCKQPPNWTENLLSLRSSTDLFGNYQRTQNSANPDLNFNVALTLALDSPDSIAVNDIDYQTNIGQNAPINSYSNPMVNMHDLYSIAGNNQSYRPSSAMTDLSIDSGFLSNSPLQHFSPADTTLQNCFGNNVQRNGASDYKDLHDSNRLSMTNITIPNEQFQFLQQQGRTYKLDQAVDQDYKHLIDYYPSVNELTASSTNCLDRNENVCLTSNSDHRIDNSLLKIISPKSKNIENKTYLPIGFPKNFSSRNVQQPAAKYGYHNYHNFTANNGEALKMFSQSSASYHNDLKQPNTANAYKMEGFDLSKEMAFPSVSQLTNQVVGSSLNKDAFNYIMKQRHHIPRIKNATGIPPADVIFNSGIIPSPNTMRSGVFPSVLPVSVPLQAPRLFSVLYGGGLNLRNGSGAARRIGPSSILHFRLEQTYEQFKQLEKERKKCEAGLAAHFPGKKVTSANNIPIPRPQGNSSRVDRLIIDYLREHARVITLIAKMECLRGTTMNQRVHKAMEYWLEAIKFVQECRNREIANATKRQKGNPPCMLVYNDNDILTLAGSVYELTKASRYARTGMYNALQATLLYNPDVEKKVVETSKDPVLAMQSNESQTASGVEDYSNCT